MGKNERDILRDWFKLYQRGDHLGNYFDSAAIFQHFMVHFTSDALFGRSPFTDSPVDSLPADTAEKIFKFQFLPEINDFLAAFTLKSMGKSKDREEFVKKSLYVKRCIVEDALFHASFIQRLRVGSISTDEQDEVLIFMSERAKLDIAAMKLDSSKYPSRQAKIAQMDFVLKDVATFIEQFRQRKTKEQLALLLQAVPLLVYLGNR